MCLGGVLVVWDVINSYRLEIRRKARLKKAEEMINHIINQITETV